MRVSQRQLANSRMRLQNHAGSNFGLRWSLPVVQIYAACCGQLTFEVSGDVVCGATPPAPAALCAGAAPLVASLPATGQ